MHSLGLNSLGLNSLACSTWSLVQEADVPASVDEGLGHSPSDIRTPGTEILWRWRRRQYTAVCRVWLLVVAGGAQGGCPPVRSSVSGLSRVSSGANAVVSPGSAPCRAAIMVSVRICLAWRRGAMSTQRRPAVAAYGSHATGLDPPKRHAANGLPGPGCRYEMIGSGDMARPPAEPGTGTSRGSQESWLAAAARIAVFSACGLRRVCWSWSGGEFSPIRWRRWAIA